MYCSLARPRASRSGSSSFQAKFVAALMSHKETQATGGYGGPLIFPDQAGGYVRRQNFNRRDWAKLLERAADDSGLDFSASRSTRSGTPVPRCSSKQASPSPRSRPGSVILRSPRPSITIAMRYPKTGVVRRTVSPRVWPSISKKATKKATRAKFRSRRWEQKTPNPLQDGRFNWCRERESNSRHQVFQTCALPTELSRHVRAVE